MKFMKKSEESALTNWARVAGLSVATTLVSLAAIEMTLRAVGNEPWRVQTLDRNEPTVHEPHPELGWRNRPGRYEIPAYTAGTAPLTQTLLEDGSRATRADPGVAAAGDPRPELWLLGGSFTKGTAVSDQQTFGWKLQSRFPAIRVRNFATGGYGTYQSLLMMEHQLLSYPAPALVVYGYISDHQARNVATWQWLAHLSRYSSRGHIDVPFATVGGNGQLVRHAPQRYPAWPLRTSLVTVASAQQVFAKLREGNRADRREAVTLAAIRELNALSKSRGSEFVVVLLNALREDRHRMLAHLREAEIDAADCAKPLTPDRIVEGEGVHPNESMHALYAECLAKRITGVMAAR